MWNKYKLSKMRTGQGVNNAATRRFCIVPHIKPLDKHSMSVSTSTQSKHVSLQEDKRILVVEDDPDIAKLISLHLQDSYREVVIAPDGTQGYNLASQQAWDLILLDVRLPGKDGLQVCRELRANHDYVPILMLTSKSSELDRVLGLETGADDYVTKPFSVIELTARIRAIFRRVDAAQKEKPKAELPSNDQIITSPDQSIRLDMRQYTVFKKEKKLDLTAKEFDLLCYFLQNPGNVFSRAHLLSNIWGYGHEGYEHTVNSHINRLRAKIEDDPTKPTLITTVWGVGYRLA